MALQCRHWLRRRCVPLLKLLNGSGAPRTQMSAAFLEKARSHKDRQTELLEAMSSGTADSSKISEYSIEISKLGRVVELYDRLQGLHDDAEVAQELAQEGSDELVDDLKEIQEEVEEVEASLVRALVPRDAADEQDAILEVRPGVGGDEAGLFALELFEMYRKFCAGRGWQFTEMSMSMTELGGLREAIASVEARGREGAGPFGTLKHEVGVHRVQRVPVNDTKLQTSSASIVVLPEAEKVDVEISEGDLRIDTYRSGGNGGQSVNTTDSAVRITHLPTGTVVAIQDERSQHQNKRKALRVLAARIREAQEERRRMEAKSERSAQIGRGDRSERIRTYNYAQDRITDHRVQKTVHGIGKIASGLLVEEFSEHLKERELNTRLELLERGEEN